MRKYIRAVHGQDEDGRGFIVWAEKRKSGGWKQRGYTWDALLRHVRKVEGERNMYLSLQTFCAPFRRAETLFKLNAIGFDIDFHKGQIAPETIMETYHALEKELFEGGGLPPPSMAIFTGRGLQLLYLLEPLPRQGLPLWKMVGEAMAKRLREALPLGELDENYGDVTRVLRLPGTFNTEAGVYAEIIGDDGAEPVRYRLDDLRDRYLQELAQAHISPPKAAPEKRVIALYNAFSLHLARLEDIERLRALRAEKDMPEDCRRRMVFLYRYWSCFAIGSVNALEASQSFNRGFKVDLPSSVVEQATRSAEKAYRLWLEDSKRGYNYRNETLVKLLGITAEEQREMKSIIGAEEKRRRQKDKGWYNKKRDDARAEKREEQEAAIMAMLETGMTQRAIREATGKSHEFIVRVAKAKKTKV